MNPSEREPAKAFSQRLYRRLLLAYPKRVRTRDSAGMEYAFYRQLCERRERGRFALMLFWARSALHAVWFGLCERTAEAKRRQAVRRGSRKTNRIGARGGWLRRFGPEVRYAVRRISRRPSLTVTAVSSLALGIGTTTVVFCLVNAVLIEPLPYPESTRLVGVWHTDPETPEWGHAQISFLFYRDNNRAFVDMGAYRSTAVTITGAQEPEEISAAIVSASTLAVLGVAPALGRGFLEEEEHPDAEHTAILSHRLWTRRFGARRDIVGQQVRIDGKSRTVVGVMPAGFQFPDFDSQIWLPMEIDRARPDRSYWNCSVIARLKPGTGIERAQYEMKALTSRLPEAYDDPESVAATLDEIRLSSIVTLFKDDVVGDVSVALWIIFGSVGFVLLIACANAANIFLAGAEGRRQEDAVRTSLGASRGTLFLTFLVESTILGLSAGLLGLGLAYVSIPTIISLTPQNVPRLEGVGISSSVLMFALGVSVFGSLFLGLMPSLHSNSSSLASSLQKGGHRIAGGLRTRVVRNGLAVLQLALALVLLMGCGLMIRSFQHLRSVDPGFESDGVMTFRLRTPGSLRESTDRTVAFYTEVLERVRAVPGVISAGAGSGLPLAGGGSMLGHSFEDFPLGPNDHVPNYLTLFALPGYLETMQVPLVAGRTFERADLQNTSRAVLVSEPLAARLWPGQSAIGKRLTPARFEVTGVWYEIVGVVGPVRHESIEAAATEAIYYPLRPLFFSSGADPLFTETLGFAVRSGLSPEVLIGPVSEAVWSVSPDQPITHTRTMADIVAKAGARTTFSMTLLTIAAVVALALGLMGLYGVMAFLVSQRTREFGIRMALGADCGSVSRMVLAQSFRLAFAGLLFGMAGTLAMARLFRSMLYDVGSTDPLTLTTVSALLLCTSLAASYAPARRAARVDPLVALAEL